VGGRVRGRKEGAGKRDEEKLRFYQVGDGGR